MWAFLDVFVVLGVQEAGISAKLAPTVGIAVDHRRRNRSLESLQENANRLKAYKAKLVVFPRRAGKTKAGDASAEELKAVAQLQGAVMPLSKEKVTLEFTTVTTEQKVRGNGSGCFTECTSSQ